MFEIRVNGKTRTAAPGDTVASLIDQLGLTGKRVAIERNGSIVPRSAHADTPLSADDALEIVAAVGGG